jgi:hypothetical protein
VLTALNPQTIITFTFAGEILPRELGYPMKTRTLDVRAVRSNQCIRFFAHTSIMGANGIAAMVADPSSFRLGREFAILLDMTPRQNSIATDAPAKQSIPNDPSWTLV